jgi:hypothetical protein
MAFRPDRSSWDRLDLKRPQVDVLVLVHVPTARAPALEVVHVADADLPEVDHRSDPVARGHRQAHGQLVADDLRDLLLVLDRPDLLAAFGEDRGHALVGRHFVVVHHVFLDPCGFAEDDLLVDLASLVHVAARELKLRSALAEDLDARNVNNAGHLHFSL